MAGLNIGVLGCGGRMGQALLNQITAASDTTISGGTELQGSDWIGRDLGDITGLGPVGVDVTSDTASLFQASDAIVDFTAPSTSQNHAGLAARTETPLVIGTTGRRHRRAKGRANRIRGVSRRQCGGGAFGDLCRR
jgi:4-hydroxy-tetrahydrodipicolinate reductase